MKAVHLVAAQAVFAAVFAFALAPAAAETARPADSEISDWIEEAIAGDPRVRGDDLAIATHEGIVTLSGSVSTLAGRRYAVLAAQKIYGVLGVIDQVEVEPRVRVDVEIESAVRSRIANSAFIDSGKIEVTVRKGVVRLAGEVNSESERYEAELMAGEVVGVRDVQSFLATNDDEERDDPQILRDVTATLRRDVHLARLPIEVAVTQGEVTLSGSVGRAYEKTLAESRARWVNGVSAVHNQLLVEWWGDGGERVIAAPEPRTDAALSSTVIAQLQQDGRIDAANITLATDRGRVILRGRVSSLLQKRIAEEDAWNVAGVGWVANEITVAAKPRPDAETSDAIRSAISADSQLSDTRIGVRVEASVATLEGFVSSRHQRAHAGAIASRTRGVERLENRLVIETADPRKDDDIAADVRRRLERNWRTAVIDDEIQVQVEAGIVTLTGRVDAWADRRSAGLSAAAARGVKQVRNRIVVQPYPYPWQERQPDTETEGAPDWDLYYFDHPSLPWIASADPGRSRRVG